MSDSRKNKGENKQEQRATSSKMIGALEETALSAFPLQEFKLELPPNSTLIATRLIPEEKSMLGICWTNTFILNTSPCVSIIRKWNLESKEFKDLASHRHKFRLGPVACLLGDQRYILADPSSNWFTSSDHKDRGLEGNVKALHMIDENWLVAQSSTGNVAVWDINSTKPLFSKKSAELKDKFTGYINPSYQPTLHALSNKRFAVSYLGFHTVIWDLTSLANPITHRLPGMFLCETSNTIVSISHYSDSDRRELLQFDKNNYDLIHRCPIAEMPDLVVALPNDCFVIGYIEYQQPKRNFSLCYFNNRLELFAQADFKSDFGNSALHSIYQGQRESYPLLIRSNGTVLGDPLKCCLEPGLVNSLPNRSDVETVVTNTLMTPRPLARLIIEYAGIEPHPIAKERFVGFFNHLIEFLSDSKRFPELNTRPWYTRLFSGPTRMEAFVQALALKQLDQGLSQYELEAIENGMVNQLNTFIKLLSEGDRKKIVDYFHQDELLKERRVGIPDPFSLITLEAIISFRENKPAVKLDSKGPSLIG